MLGLALLGEQVALNEHVPHHPDDREGRAEVLAKAAVLPHRRAHLPPHLVHDVPGGVKKNIVQCLAVVAVLVIVVIARVAVGNSGVILDNVTHLAHRWAVLAIIVGGGRRGGRSRGTHLVCL